MNIKQIKEAITTQSNKISQLEKDLLQAEAEKAELEKLEKSEKMKYRQKISQAAHLLKEAQIIAGCDQENIINDVIEEMSSKLKEEKEDIQLEENPQPSDVTVLQVLNEQLEISTEPSTQLPENAHIQNNKTLLAFAEPLDSQPVPTPFPDGFLLWLEDFKKIPREILELSTAVYNRILLPRYPQHNLSTVISAFIYSNGRSLRIGNKGKEELKNELTKKLGLQFENDTPRHIGNYVYCHKEAIVNWQETLEIKSVPEASPETLFRKKVSEFDNISIEKLELSESIHNELKKTYTTVAQLLSHIINEDSFNVGRKGENEIRKQLSKKFGLIFKGKNVRYAGEFLYCQLPSLDSKQVA